MPKTPLKTYICSASLGIFIALALPSLATAQEESIQSLTDQVTPRPADFLAFAQHLAQVAEQQNGDCDAMVLALKASLAEHQPMLDRINYAHENADDDTVRGIYEAAQALGEHAAKCYEHQGLADLLKALTQP